MDEVSFTLKRITFDEVDCRQTNNVPPPDFAQKSHRDLWKELIKENEHVRKEVEEYNRSKMEILDPTPHPIIDYLNESVFPVLNCVLMKMLKKVKEQENEVFTEGDTYLNSLNFIAEYLWNMNPRHPERSKNWTDISDITW